MQGDINIIQTLNNCLRDQLTAINQFFLHARMAKDWGLDELNEYEYKRSIKAMKMADDLIERVLFLEGLPNLQDLGKLMIGENVPEILKGDIFIQSSARTGLQDAIHLAEDTRDYVTRDLLSNILEETEEHIDWIETQQWLIANTGFENYLQSQMGDD